MNCCKPVQVLALARLRPATTSPSLGEMVKVPLALAVTEVTPPPPPVVIQTLLMEKQPPTRLMPLENVLVALEPVMFK